MEYTMSKERNYGIDLLRIVSMYLVVILHLLGSADIEAYLPLCSLKYEVAWLLEMVAFCAVNCYALISGYVSVGKKYHLSNLIVMWFQVLLYSVLITGVFKIFYPESVGSKRMICSFFPVLTGQYWYFTAYVGLCFFMPALKYIIDKMSEVELKRVVLAGVLLLSVFPMLAGRDVFQTANGYSMLWLGYLFVVGGYIRKYNRFADISTKRLLLILAGSIVVPIGIKFLIEYISWNYFGRLIFDTTFTKYTSINVVIEAIVMLMLFTRIKVSDFWKKVVAFVAPASFGVYLIHSNELVLENLMFGKLELFAQFSVVGMTISILVIGLGVFCACILIEFVRIELFKMCKIRMLAEKIDRKVLHW